ncbi:MAG: hypothetical protein GY707_17500 [Desulfobacteraceae bacterium]|nr:hypothetical protein [Desulfobacteraceae bacterium]
MEPLCTNLKEPWESQTGQPWLSVTAEQGKGSPRWLEEGSGPSKMDTSIWDIGDRLMASRIASPSGHHFPGPNSTSILAHLFDEAGPTPPPPSNHSMAIPAQHPRATNNNQ